MSFLEKVCKEYGIDLYPLSVFSPVKGMEDFITRSKGGASIKDSEGDISIAIDDTAPARERDAIAAHELGHVILGYLDGKYKLSEEQCENEARLFSVVIIAMSLYDKYRSYIKAEF